MKPWPLKGKKIKNPSTKEIAAGKDFT